MDWNSVTALPWDHILEVLGFITGILYIWWEYHADPRLWLVSVIMPVISMWLYFKKGLYADFGINIYYFLIAIYGYIVWTHRPDKKYETRSTTQDQSRPEQSPHNVSSSLKIRHITPRILMASIGCELTLWIILYAILHYLTDSTVPVADAFTTSLSIVGMWLLAKKYIEQWIAWIMVDAVCVGLYVYKGIYLYATLYLIYTVIACFGYRKWQSLMARQ